MHFVKVTFRVAERVIYVFISFPISLLFVMLSLPLLYFRGQTTPVGLVIAYIPFKFGEYIRFIFYKITLKKVGRGTIFKFGSYCQYSNSSIGDNVLIGYFNSIGEVEIGNDVLLGGYVNIISGTNQHGFTDNSKLIREQEGTGRRKILVGNNVWVGSNVTIANDIGSRCVIGLGSVVVNEINSHSLAVGNPCKLIKVLT